MGKPRLTFFYVFVPLAAQVAFACLPTDTRPPPASLLLTASSDEAVQQGFDTDDGWHIEFSKFLVSLGQASFMDDNSCAQYAGAGYERVLNMRQQTPQKVNLIYGLGLCTLRYSVAYPTVEDTVAGSGVASADVLTMQTQGSDRFVAGRGINGLVSGTATSLGQRMTFDWSFRQNWTYDNCSDTPDAGIGVPTVLVGNAADTVNLTVHGEDLFRGETEAGQSQLLFAPMALADTQLGNNDGTVSMDELSAIRVPATPIIDAQGKSGSVTNGANLGVTDAGSPAADDLQALVYLVRYPHMYRYGENGECEIVPGRTRGED